MSNAEGHDHFVANSDRVVEYSRTDADTYDTGQFVDAGTVVAHQEYTDHAGRDTTVNEYDSGRVDVFVGPDQPTFWGGSA
jgi:hypothetical protein